MIITNYYTDGYHANGVYKWLRLNFLCRWSQARVGEGTWQFGSVWNVVNELFFFDNWHVVVCKSGNWPGLSFIPQQAIILAGSHINYSFYTCLTLCCYSVHPEINVHIFSILFFVHFPKYRQGEYVLQSRASLISWWSFPLFLYLCCQTKYWWFCHESREIQYN